MQQQAASKIQHESNVNYASLGVTPTALNKAEQSSQPGGMMMN